MVNEKTDDVTDCDVSVRTNNKNCRVAISSSMAEGNLLDAIESGSFE